MLEIRNVTLDDYLARPHWSNTKVYRGVSDVSYELVTTIGRLPLANDNLRSGYEREVFREFKRRAHPFLQKTPASDMEWLFLARHYNLPTRLLDWTTNPLVALFFATESDKPSDFAVYTKLVTSWYDTVSPDSDLFEDLKEGIGLRPPHTDARYLSQSGVFTIHPSYRVDTETERIVKFVFPASSRDDVRERLNRYGILPSLIYANLEGVAKDILRQNSFPNADGSRSVKGWDWA